jgi:hypothetical protein
MIVKTTGRPRRSRRPEANIRKVVVEFILSLSHQVYWLDPAGHPALNQAANSQHQTEWNHQPDHRQNEYCENGVHGSLLKKLIYF